MDKRWIRQGPINWIFFCSYKQLRIFPKSEHTKLFQRELTVKTSKQYSEQKTRRIQAISKKIDNVFQETNASPLVLPNVVNYLGFSKKEFLAHYKQRIAFEKVHEKFLFIWRYKGTISSKRFNLQKLRGTVLKICKNEIKRKSIKYNNVEELLLSICFGFQKVLFHRESRRKKQKFKLNQQRVERKIKILKLS